MTAPGELREQLVHCRNLAQRALDELDVAVRAVDAMDDAVIDGQLSTADIEQYHRSVQNLRAEKDRL